MTTPSPLGRPAHELSDQELEQQGKQAHATRNHVFLHGTVAQFSHHTSRMLELELEYLRRYPKRTWQGFSGGGEQSEIEALRSSLAVTVMQLQLLISPPSTPHGDVPVADDPARALLRRLAAAEGGRLHKLEVHQISRELGLDRTTLAKMYSGDDPLITTDRENRVITDRGRRVAAED